DPDARTPHLDQLAAEGLRASHAFTHCPVCAPSRSGLVTGCYPYSIGSHQMRSTLLDPPPLFTRALKEAGYQVSWPGKTDFNFELRPEEISDQRDWMREGFPSNGPWFCYANLFQTHESNMWPEPDGEGQRWCQIHRENLPRSQRCDPASLQIPPYLPDCPEVREDLARHHDNVRVLDQEIGTILAQLEASGQADNTIVIFAVDHGAGILRGKRWCYDLGVHMPLIIRAPGRLAPGTVHQDLVAWVDLAPQILRWADCDPLPQFQGQAFLDAEQPREFCFGGRDRMDEQFDRIRFARSSRYLYIRNYHPELPWAQRNHYMERMPSMQAWRRLHAAGQLTPQQAAWFAPEKPAEEFYDCDADPWQLDNRMADPSLAAEIQRHRAALDEHLSSVGDLGAVPEPELVQQGLVADRIAEYRARITPLPKPYDNLGGPWDITGRLWPR
ncbi:MAG: hypothetical protein EA401_09160, partial [Planctomycetota bacterium]